MSRVKGRKYHNDDLYKQYLLEKGRISKSDKIFITSIDNMPSGQFTRISYRKLFIESHQNNGFYRMKNSDFKNWIIIKQRINKINQIKVKISNG